MFTSSLLIVNALHRVQQPAAVHDQRPVHGCQAAARAAEEGARRQSGWRRFSICWRSIAEGSRRAIGPPIRLHVLEGESGNSAYREIGADVRVFLRDG